MYPKDFFAQSRVAERKGKCFVIMPFAPEFDEIYGKIGEAMERARFTCSRADDIRRGGSIPEDVFRRMAEAEIIIADLTGNNPNVLYELGIAHTIKDVEKVILLSQDANAIPFDLREFRHIAYRRPPEGSRELKDALISYVKEATSLQFELRGEPGTYKLPHKVLGPDYIAYDFEIKGSYYALNAVKIDLCVTRYVLGEAPTIVFTFVEGMNEGEYIRLPGMERDLRLEEGAVDYARFSVQ